MEVLPNDLNGYRIHMIGIKGTGMTALTQLLVSRGAVITGSDVKDVFYTDEILKSLSIEVAIFDEANIKDDIDLVIYSAAYAFKTNVELKETLKKIFLIFLIPKLLENFHFIVILVEYVEFMEKQPLQEWWERSLKN